MSFVRPSLADLRARALLEVEQRIGAGPLLPRSLVGALAQAQGALTHHLHGHLVTIADQLFPESADQVYLERAADRYGILRKPAARAVGTIVVGGTEGAVVPVGLRARRADGVEYETTASGTVTLPSLQAEVAAQAVEPGAAANVDGGTALTLNPPSLGLTSAAEAGAGGFDLGADAESDEELRERVLRRLRAPPQGAEVYVQWALEVPGVTRAWAHPVYLGQLGHVGLSFAVDDDPGGPIPGGAKVDEVEAYVEARRPVGVVLHVFAPTALPLDPEVAISPDTLDVRQAIEDALVDLLRAEGGPGRTVLLSHVRAAISNAFGEFDHDLSVPAADVTAATGELHVLGTPTFSAL